jgi:uncharacterized protein YbjT (DUF2867 family)
LSDAAARSRTEGGRESARNHTMKRIVILGGTGFVGTQLVRRLATDGHCVTVLSRNRERHRELGVLPGVRVRSINVYDTGALSAALREAKAEIAINLVGILNESGSDGSGFTRAHVTLTETLLAAMRDADVPRLVQMSALNAGRGTSHYLRTRGEAEARVKASDRAWTLLQPSVIFGPGDGLFCRFETLLRLTPVLPLARATARFAPVYVGDVVDAFARVAADPAMASRTFELYGPRTITLGEIVRWTRDLLGLRRPVFGLPDALGALQAAIMGLVPGKPLSLDNFRSLAVDSVGTRDGLAELGISATSMERIVPAMLQVGDRAHQRHLDGWRARR